MDNSKGIVIDSVKPIESKHMPKSLKSWGKLYIYILAFIFLLFEMIYSRSIGEAGYGIAFLLAIIFVVIIFISRIRNRGNVSKAIEEINGIKFKIDNSVTVADIFNKIETDRPKIYSRDMTFKREADKVSVTYEEITYEIILNGDGTFSVVGKIASNPNKAFYDEIRKGTPIIAFGLQQAFGVK